MRSSEEHKRTRALMDKRAGAYAEAYERYLTLSVAQVDQISMHLKHSWERTHDVTRIEDMRREGMFTDSAFVNVSVAGPDGAALSSSRWVI